MIPVIMFWLSVLVYAAGGSEHFMIRAFADLEQSPSGVTIVVFIVIGCPFFALPLSVLGRWMARTEHQKGQGLGTLLLLLSIAFLILGTVGSILWS
jgi:surface polysaccharide O-acyltransferase-like enzyme